MIRDRTTPRARARVVGMCKHRGVCASTLHDVCVCVPVHYVMCVCVLYTCIISVCIHSYAHTYTHTYTHTHTHTLTFACRYWFHNVSAFEGVSVWEGVSVGLEGPLCWVVVRSRFVYPFLFPFWRAFNPIDWNLGCSIGCSRGCSRDSILIMLNIVEKSSKMNVSFFFSFSPSICSL